MSTTPSLSAHVQHDVDNDETAGPPSTSTEWREMSIRGGEGPLCSCFFKQNYRIMAKFTSHKMNHLKCATQWHFTPSQWCATIASIGFQSIFPTQSRPTPTALCASFQRLWACYSPAVHHQWARVGRALRFDLPDESQQPCGMVRDPVIGPASEVKLSDLSDFMNAPLPFPVSTMQEENKGKHMMSNQESIGTPRQSVSLGRETLRRWEEGHS